MPEITYKIKYKIKIASKYLQILYYYIHILYYHNTILLIIVQGIDIDSIVSVLRFSKDIGIIDKKLPFTMFDVIVMFLSFTGTIVILTTVNAWLLIPTSFVIVLFYYIRVVYITTSRAVKRMEGTSK